MNVIIIPARGGSKRVPGKNIKNFYGKPIIAWPIAIAQASGLFDRIIVSTDSEESGLPVSRPRRGGHPPRPQAVQRHARGARPGPHQLRHHPL